MKERISKIKEYVLNKINYNVALIYIFPVISIFLLIIKVTRDLITGERIVKTLFDIVSIVSSNNAGIVSTLFIVRDPSRQEQTIGKRFLCLILSIVSYLVIELYYQNIKLLRIDYAICGLLMIITFLVTYLVYKDYCETSSLYGKERNKNVSVRMNAVKNEDSANVEGKELNIKG